MYNSKERRYKKAQSTYEEIARKAGLPEEEIKKTVNRIKRDSHSNH